MKPPSVRDVRALMPNYATYAQRATGCPRAQVTGIAIHHSAIVHNRLGISVDSAFSIFLSQTQGRGWEHGGYHYFVYPHGKVEYALDEAIAGFHAGFRDPDDRLGLEYGQYWNNHYLAICLLGWFDCDRRKKVGRDQWVTVPNRFTRPTEAQMAALVWLVNELRQRYEIPVENVRGHRELAGCATRCPGANVDLDALRDDIR